MKNKTLLIIAGFTVLLLVGMIILSNMPTVGGSFGYGMPRPGKKSTDDRVVVTNAPPQIVYRIDEHRFLTLENYIACDKSGQVYFNDTELDIKTRINTVNRSDFKDDGTIIRDYYPGDDQIQMKDVKNGIMSFSGMLLYETTNGALVFPYVNNTWSGCDNNRGCNQGAMVSVDKGRTFYNRIYEKSYSYPGLRTLIKVGNSSFFRGDVNRYGVKEIPFDPLEIVSENMDIKFDKEVLDNRAYDTRFHCDNTIKPTQIKFIRYERNVK